MKHKRAQKIITKMLDEEKEMTTGEIYDRLRNYQAYSSKRHRRNTSLNVPMNALVNIMKRKGFVKVGFVKRNLRTGTKAQAVWSNEEE